MTNSHSEVLLKKVIEGLQQTPGLPPGAPVLAAMSGGVDSSVVAALLHHAGFRVTGVSMLLHGKMPESEVMCGTPEAFQDARRVAEALGIPHHVVDFTDRFESEIIDPFVASYLNGETPSPCVLCNQHLKFGALVRKADELGIRFIATGHYARIQRDEDGYHLLKAQDAAKDQSYFLARHTQNTLSRTLFPLASLSKPEVRALASILNLHLAEKEESQDICFMGNQRYDSLIESRGQAPKVPPGPLRHVADGRVMGMHQGFWRFTVGQRKGLLVAHSEPLYVIRLEPSSNTVWVGEKAYLSGTNLMARDLNWCRVVPADGMRCAAKIRSRAKEAEAILHFPEETGRVRVEFTEPQQAITPGQAVVFYDGDEVLGGGWIVS